MAVGLDIGSKALKLVDLAKDGDGWRLRASGIVSYSGNSVDNMKSDKEFALLAEAIKKLHKESKASSKEVVISLPETKVFVRPVKFPLLTDSEIASAVKWEAEQYIPMPKEEAIIQHQIIERRETSSPPSTLVLLVAAPKETVNKYAKVVEMAGLRLTVVETELMALVRALAPVDQTVMIVDFGATSTDIAIAKDKQLMFSRSIPTAGDAFTRAVAQGLGVEQRQAEEYKKAYGLSADQLDGKVKTVLDPVFRTVVDEMKKANQFYKSDTQEDPATGVLLAGGTSNLPDVVSYFAKSLGIEVVIGNPFQNVKVDPEASKSLAGYAPLYSIATGLAMRS